MTSSAYSDFAHDPQPVLHSLARSWWLILLRGLAGIAFGVLAFAWPALTLLTLVFLYGAYALIDGIVALVAAISGRGQPAPTWWLIVVGLCGVAAGLVTLFWPGITAVVLLLFIGAWAIVHGVFEILGAIRLRKEIDNEWLLVLAGALSVAFGVLVIAMPGAGALGLIWVIGAYSIAFGILQVGLSLRLRKHQLR